MSLEKALHTPDAHTTAGRSPDTTMVKQIILTRRSPAYWRVMFDHPPLNIFGPETIPQLNEIITAPESWTEKAYPKLIHYNRLPKGGHFAAWEQPELFTNELRAAFAPLRSGFTAKH
jgi:pimeloyl-ACP methyl ester carboxylesterase